MDKLLYFGLIVTVLSDLVHGQTQTTESVCTNSKGEYRQGDRQISDNYWTLNGDECHNEKSVLVLQLQEMKVTYRRQCTANVLIPALKPSTELCKYSKDTCFVVTTKNAPVDISISVLTSCKRIEWVMKEEMFPITVRFNKLYTGPYSFGFNYSYYENKGVQTTTDAPTTTVGRDTATSDELVTESTSLAGATESSGETEKVYASENVTGYITGIVLLSILLIFAIGALLFVLARQNKDLVEKWLKRSKEDDNPSPSPESSPPQGEQVYSDVYGVANEVYDEVEFGNERETVDNQLYGMV